VDVSDNKPKEEKKPPKRPEPDRDLRDPRKIEKDIPKVNILKRS